MKRGTFLTVVIMLLSSLFLNAQTYDVSALTSGEIAAGGNAQWSFERYTYKTETYSVLQFFGDSSRINFRDKFNPERFQGVLIGDEDSSDETLYANKRNSWFDDKNEYVYIGEDMEVYSQMFANSAIVFTIPEDGYYKVEATVLREDGWMETPLKAVFRYRYDGETEVKSLSSLGFDFDFGAGALNTDESYVDETNTMQKWIKQEPVSKTFYVNATTGSKLTFEVDCHNYGLAADYSGREVWARSKWTNLVVTKSAENEATAAENYIDPYDASYETPFFEAYGIASDELNNALVGNGIGEYPQAAFNEFESALTEIYGFYEAGKINILNVSAYVTLLQEATKEFTNEANIADWTQDYNYRLFPYDEGNAEEVKAHADIFSKTVTSPWNFMTYAVSSGEYTDCQNYGTGGKITDRDAWYDSAGDWFFITVDGIVHPTTSKSPAIVFEATKDGIYRVGATIFRENPNPRVVNEMWARFRFIPNGQTAVAKETSMGLDKPYGLPTDNYPVKTDFFVKLKTGDRITFEEDCYTANRNSSAGSIWQRLFVATMQGSYADIEAEIAKDTLAYINPYTAGDFSELESKVTEAEGFLTSVTVGTELGQFSQENVEMLEDVIASADTLITENSAGQAFIDSKYAELALALKTFKESVNVSIDFITDGYYYVKVKDGKGGFLYLTDNNWVNPESGTAKDTIFPAFFPKVDTNEVIQLFKFTYDDSKTRYRIDSKLRVDNSGTYTNSFIQESGTFSFNPYSADWNSFTMKYNGTSYSMQRGGRPGTQYIEIGEHVLSGDTLDRLVVKAGNLEADNFIFYLEAASVAATQEEKNTLQAAIENANAALTNTTEGTELGKFTTEVRNVLSGLINSGNTVLSAQNPTSSDVTGKTKEITEGIKTYYNAFNQVLNTIDLGYYYVKISDGSGGYLYLTDLKLIDPASAVATDSIFPTFMAKNAADQTAQLFRFAIDTSVNRVRIDSKARIDDPSNFVNTYVAEGAKFGYNPYNNAWNTYNLYYNGSIYAIQRAGSAGSNYWYPADVADYKRILTDNSASAYENLYFELEYVMEAPDVLTSTTELESQSVKVWGTKGAISIEGAQGTEQVEVYNLLGQKVNTETLSSDAQTLIVDKGIYIVRVSGESNFAVKVLVY